MAPLDWVLCGPKENTARTRCNSLVVIALVAEFGNVVDNLDTSIKLLSKNVGFVHEENLGCSAGEVVSQSIGLAGRTI